MKTLDVINIIASRIYNVDPNILLSRSKNERLVYARFTAISLRNEDGVGIVDLADMYNLNQESIRYAIRKTSELIKFNVDFRKKYNEARYMYKLGVVPFSPEHLKCGSEVRTRVDSLGISRCGVVTTIKDSTFTVEAYDDREYKTVHDVDTGRINVDYESSLDIVAISL